MENIFNEERYPTLSGYTRTNKTNRHIRYMLNMGWIVKRGFKSKALALYEVVENPYLQEMPAQAEPIDPEYAKESALQALAAYREA